MCCCNAKTPTIRFALLGARSEKKVALKGVGTSQHIYKGEFRNGKYRFLLFNRVSHYIANMALRNALTKFRGRDGLLVLSRALAVAPRSVSSELPLIVLI